MILFIACLCLLSNSLSRTCGGDPESVDDSKPDLQSFNRTVGFRLLTKFGTKGAINLSKAIPVIGGLIGGGLDAYSTKVIGNKAKDLFILGQNESPIVTIDATVE